MGKFRGVHLCAAFAAALGSAGAVMAITPPTVTQPKPGVLRFTIEHPTVRVNGKSLSLSELSICKLYISFEQAAIAVPVPATSYSYVVPVGYTTKEGDVAAATCVDTDGAEGPATPPVALPVGVTTPKSPPGAPTSLGVVVVP